MKKVVVVDYGVGNLLSVSRALENVEANVILTSNPHEIVGADRIVLPGVGAFGDCMVEIKRRGLAEAITDFVATERPLLGICVGMQVLHSVGREFGDHKGLGLIEGVVDKIPSTRFNGIPHKVPHIGWAKLCINEANSGNKLAPMIFDKWFYFVHGYMATPSNNRDILAYYVYNGRNITACTHKDNIYGLQFHPEKSGEDGLNLLEKFLSI
jgi:glutamine amidotransferase